MTWKRAQANGIYRCGSCGNAIGDGELVAFTRTGAERCEPCGRKIEDPPADVPVEAAETGVSQHVRKQPSFGFGRIFSTGDLARTHAARHFHRRTSQRSNE